MHQRRLRAAQDLEKLMAALHQSWTCSVCDHTLTTGVQMRCDLVWTLFFHGEKGEKSVSKRQHQSEKLQWLKSTVIGSSTTNFMADLMNKRLMKNSKEDKLDPPIHTEYFHTGETTTLNFIVDGDNAVNSLSCSQKSLGTWSCHVMARHGVHFIADVNVALNVALDRSVVEPTGEIWLEQHFRASRNVRRDSDDVSDWEHVGLILVTFRSRLELCVVIKTTVAKILFDIPNTLPLCGGSEGVHTGSQGRHVRGGLVDRLKYDQRYALSVSLGVQKSLREQKTGCSSVAATSSL